MVLKLIEAKHKEIRSLQQRHLVAAARTAALITTHESDSGTTAGLVVIHVADGSICHVAANYNIPQSNVWDKRLI